MLQQINKTDLIPGEMYYIKYNFNTLSKKVIMIHYKNHNGRMLALVNDSTDFLVIIKYWTFYRYVSEKEYKEKRKEYHIKSDSLNIHHICQLIKLAAKSVGYSKPIKSIDYSPETVK